jgi:Fe-S-cluster containining protein
MNFRLSYRRDSLEKENTMDDCHARAESEFFITMLKDEARTALWKVGSSVDPQTLVESILEELQALAPREDGTDNRTQEQVWDQVRERLIKAAYATRPQCIRCGTCCTTSSPTLLEEDFDLLRRDVLRPEHLITIRKGEPAYSPRSGEAGPAEKEIVKLREKPGGRSCFFYENWDKSCSIYESRPAQCRRQECWNPEAADGTGDVALERKRLLQSVKSLWEVIQRHEEKCSHEEFNRAVIRLGATRGQTVEELLDLLRFDHHVREFIVEELGLDRQSMDFFFGRPLRESLHAYGLKLEDQPDGGFLLSPLEED